MMMSGRTTVLVIIGGVFGALITQLALTVLAARLGSVIARPPHPDDEGAVGIPWDRQAMLDADDDRRRRLTCDALETQLTSSLLKGHHVVEIYPDKPAQIRRGFDGKEREVITLEVQRSQDKAIDGKTRFRTYTWILEDVKEELR